MGTLPRTKYLHKIADTEINIKPCSIGLITQSQYKLHLKLNYFYSSIQYILSKRMRFETVHVAFFSYSSTRVLYHCERTNSATLVLYISGSIALLYVELCFRG
jgi:hypothetical protein